MLLKTEKVAFQPGNRSHFVVSNDYSVRLVVRASVSVATAAAAAGVGTVADPTITNASVFF